MEKEIWKQIKNYPNYEVSNYGRVRSLSRKVYYNNTYRRVKGRILSLKNRKGWYLSLLLKNEYGRKTFRVHRLVYSHFVGEISKGFEIHHKNGNHQDNRVKNLQMVSISEHHRLTRLEYPDICKHMIYKNKFGGKEIGQYTLEGQLINVFPNAKLAQKVTGVCSRNINQMVNNTPYKEGKYRKSAGGFIWKYTEV